MLRLLQAAYICLHMRKCFGPILTIVAQKQRRSMLRLYGQVRDVED